MRRRDQSIELSSNAINPHLEQWDKNKKISSETNIEDLSKVANDNFVSRTDKLKEINSDYSEFLKDLYKEIKKQVDFVNSKEEEKIELNYKTMSDWMNSCKNVSFMSRKSINPYF